MLTLVTLPVFNERDRIGLTLDKLDSALRTAGLEYTIAVAEDGSTDGTKSELDQLATQFPQLKVRSATLREGRGAALTTIWRETPADLYCYVDADLPAGVEGVITAIKTLVDGADVVLGSRYCPGARVVRPPVVKFASRFYNRIIRSTFDESTWDHQCGLKGFNRRALDMLLPRVHDRSWFWDTEMIVYAHRLGLRIKE